MSFLDVISEVAGWLIFLGVSLMIIALIPARTWVSRACWCRWVFVCGFLFAVLGYGSWPWIRAGGIFPLEWLLLCGFLLLIVGVGTWGGSWPRIGAGARWFTRLFMLAAIGWMLFHVFIMLWSLPHVRGVNPGTQCLSRIRDVTVALLSYAEDHDGNLPDSVTWQQDIKPYLTEDEENAEELLQCLVTRKPYIFNNKLAGASVKAIANPGEVPLVWEVSPNNRRAPHTRIDSAGLFKTHKWRSFNVGFLDGHNRGLNPTAFRQLVTESEKDAPVP